jgi:cell division protein FtsQ
MTRRAALALVRTPPLRPTVRLPTVRLPAMRLPSRRAAAVGATILGALLLLYAAARETSLFAVTTVQVAGAPAEVAADAREALASVQGRSLVAVDAHELERKLARVPTIRAASVDRAFPHALVVRVVPERPTAVYRAGTQAWLLGADGRVIAAMKPHERPRLPRIRLADPTRPNVGGTLEAGGAAVALRVLGALPRPFPARVLYAQATASGVVVVVENGLEIRLGTPTRIARKLESARAVLRTLPAEERVGIGYLDVTVPDRVVAGANIQPVSEG